MFLPGMLEHGTSRIVSETRDADVVPIQVHRPPESHLQVEKPCWGAVLLTWNSSWSSNTECQMCGLVTDGENHLVAIRMGLLLCKIYVAT